MRKAGLALRNGTLYDTLTGLPVASAGAAAVGAAATTVVAETAFGQSSAVGVAADYARSDHTHGTPAFTTVEVSLGSAARRSGSFTIAGAGLTPGKPVLIQQAVGPYTGKGTRADEAEMDQVSVAAHVVDATTIRAYWTSRHLVRGNFKMHYAVAA